LNNPLPLLRLGLIWCSRWYLCRQSVPLFTAIFFTRIDIMQEACNIRVQLIAANGVVACAWVWTEALYCLIVAFRYSMATFRCYIACICYSVLQAALDRCQRPAKALNANELVICALCWIAAWCTLLWRTLEISCDWHYYTMIIRTMPLYSCIYNGRLVAWVTMASKRDGSSVRHNSFSGCNDTVSNRVNNRPTWEETPDKLLQVALMGSVVESWKSLTKRQPTIDYIYMPR